MISPELKGRLGGLQLLARRGVPGRQWGRHPGQRHGAGLEFAQYRSYEPGDELRRVDWKLYARSDRLYVREATREAALDLWIVIDTTLSMAAADDERPHYSKLEAARQLAACLVELALRQGEAFGMLAVGGTLLQHVDLGLGPRHQARVEQALGALRCEGAAPRAAALRRIERQIGPGSLVMLCSDGFDAVLGEWLQRLSLAGRDVRSIGFLSCAERDFPFRGACVFRDPETGAERRLDAQSVRADYLERLHSGREALRRRMAACGVPHVDHVLDEPLDLPLRRLLAPAAERAAPA